MLDWTDRNWTNLAQFSSAKFCSNQLNSAQFSSAPVPFHPVLPCNIPLDSWYFRLSSAQLGSAGSSWLGSAWLRSSRLSLASSSVKTFSYNIASSQLTNLFRDVFAYFRLSRLCELYLYCLLMCVSKAHFLA